MSGPGTPGPWEDGSGPHGLIPSCSQLCGASGSWCESARESRAREQPVGLGLLINANPTPHSFLRTHNEDYSPSSLGKGLLGPHMEDAHPSYPLWVLVYSKGAGGTGWGPIPGEKNLKAAFCPPQLVCLSPELGVQAPSWASCLVHPPKPPEAVGSPRAAELEAQVLGKGKPVLSPSPSSPWGQDHHVQLACLCAFLSP